MVIFYDKATHIVIKQAIACKIKNKRQLRELFPGRDVSQIGYFYMRNIPDVNFVGSIVCFTPAGLPYLPGHEPNNFEAVRKHTLFWVYR